LSFPIVYRWESRRSATSMSSPIGRRWEWNQSWDRVRDGLKAVPYQNLKAVPY